MQHHVPKFVGQGLGGLRIGDIGPHSNGFGKEVGHAVRATDLSRARRPAHSEARGMHLRGQGFPQPFG